MTRDSHILWSFAAYTVLWELIVFGGGFWAIATLHESLWWTLLLICVSGCQFKPSAWRNLLASGTEAGTGETEGLDPKGDGPVAKPDARKPVRKEGDK